MRLSSICKIRVGPNEDIYERSVDIQNQYGFSAKDAVHLACASSATSDYFLTCDDNIIRKLKSLEKMVILNPIDYLRKEVL